MMTKAMMKAIIAAADAKGMPDEAAITDNGANLNGAARIELGKIRKNADGSEVAEIPPSIDLVQ